MRIIAGIWRGRKVEYVPQAELRPTTDRIRETLFNWLMPKITGAACLDLFSGSGIFAFEALSRGANSVTAIDNNSQVIASIEKTQEILTAKNLRVIKLDVLDFLEKNREKKYNIIFLDPPYKLNLLNKCLNKINEYNLLLDYGFLYLENDSEIIVPENWQIHRHKKAGNIHFYLLQRQKDATT